MSNKADIEIDKDFEEEIDYSDDGNNDDIYSLSVKRIEIKDDIVNAIKSYLSDIPNNVFKQSNTRTSVYDYPDERELNF